MTSQDLSSIIGDEDETNIVPMNSPELNFNNKKIFINCSGGWEYPSLILSIYEQILYNSPSKKANVIVYNKVKSINDDAIFSKNLSGMNYKMLTGDSDNILQYLEMDTKNTQKLFIIMYSMHELLSGDSDISKYITNQRQYSSRNTTIIALERRPNPNDLIAFNSDYSILSACGMRSVNKTLHDYILNGYCKDANEAHNILSSLKRNKFLLVDHDFPSDMFKYIDLSKNVEESVSKISQNQSIEKTAPREETIMKIDSDKKVTSFDNIKPITSNSNSDDDDATYNTAYDSYEIDDEVTYDSYDADNATSSYNDNDNDDVEAEDNQAFNNDDSHNSEEDDYSYKY
jgi:hypothetical protein